MTVRPLALGHSELLVQHEELGVLLSPRRDNPGSGTTRAAIKRISFNPAG
jgi:hypothetical protein